MFYFSRCLPFRGQFCAVFYLFKMSISVDRIMSNIYGPTATQETASIMGGEYRQNFFYVDDIKHNNRKQQTTTGGGFSLYGGSSKNKINYNNSAKSYKKKKQFRGGKTNITIYADLRHYGDAEINKYILDFFLEYFIDRAAPASIILIPSKTAMAELYKKLKDVIKGIPEGSSEAKKAVIENADKIGYRRYIFNRYGDNTKEQNYRISSDDSNAQTDYPNGTFETLRRTNAVGEVYYISYDSPKSVICSATPGGKGTSWDFVCRCYNCVYVFRGDLPKAAENISTAYRKHIRKSMRGGFSGTYLNSFLDFVNAYNNLDDAAESYILQRFKADPSFVSQYTNGDRVFTMFSCALSDIQNNKTSKDFDEIFGRIRNNEERKQLEKQYRKECIKNMTAADVSKRVKSVLHKMTGQKYNIITDLQKIYKNKNPLIIRADLMTSLYRNGVRDAAELFDITEDFSNGKTQNIDAYNNTLMDSYMRYPMTSVIGKNVIPISFDTIAEGVTSNSERNQETAETRNEEQPQTDNEQPQETTTKTTNNAKRSSVSESKTTRKQPKEEKFKKKNAQRIAEELEKSDLSGAPKTTTANSSDDSEDSEDSSDSDDEPDDIDEARKIKNKATTYKNEDFY